MQNDKHHTVAAIDVGSNAIRMVIAQIDPDGRVERIEDLQRAVPLGQDCFADHHLERETINLAIEVLRGFQTIMTPYRIENLRAVATSAVREAVNGDLFVERVYMATGIHVEIVTGAEEARLLYSAVRNAFADQGLPADETSLIVELGSGSAEISMFQRNRVLFSGSYPLGTIRLRSAVNPAHLSQVEAVDLMRRYIANSLDVIARRSPLTEARNFICVGSDVRFAAKQLASREDEGKPVRGVPRKAFLAFSESVSRLRPEEISRKYGLSIQDSEAVGPALLVYADLLRRSPAKTIRVPFVSMRDGMIHDFVAEQTGRGLEELEEQIFSSAETIGRRYEYDERHARHVADLACRLFDQLQEVHGLGRRERRLLRTSAILHDVGNFISNRAHHKHSEYIIDESDIFGLRDSDRALVARIARYHRRSAPKSTHQKYMFMSPPERSIVSKCAAILRVADALERGHTRKVEDVEVEWRPDEIALRVKTREDLTLERLAMREKAGMFEEVFGRKVILQN